MRSLWLLTGLIGASGVLLGAFGAHALAAQLTGRSGELWALAGQYHLVHAAALVGLCAWERSCPGDPWLRRAAWLFSGGVALFSGSLYLLALGVPWAVGWVTPLGGLLMTAGWLCLVFKALRR